MRTSKQVAEKDIHLNRDSKSEFVAVPFRIRVGVTGHRSVQDDPETRKAIHDAVVSVFWDLLDKDSNQELRRTQAQCSPPVQYEVVSPLAEGADQLVADVKLSIRDTSLKAVLPLSDSDYLATISSDQSRERFRHIVSFRWACVTECVETC
jgi:hypothetical protein